MRTPVVKSLVKKLSFLSARRKVYTCSKEFSKETELPQRTTESVGELFLTMENDEIRGLGPRFRGAGALWSTILVQILGRIKAKKHPPGDMVFETLGRILGQGSGKNEHAQKSLRSSCGAVLARS